MIVEDQKIILKGIEKMFRHFCQDEIFPFSDPALFSFSFAEKLSVIESLFCFVS